jgi:hypothetical protein
MNQPMFSKAFLLFNVNCANINQLMITQYVFGDVLYLIEICNGCQYLL